MQYGTLYLLPTPLSECELQYVLPQHNINLISALNHFICEDAKTARRFLKRCNYPNIQAAEVQLLNEHTPAQSYGEFIVPALNGFAMGLMSDAGCPGIADPGAEIIKMAHQKGLKVIPLVGPSSVVLTVMASGFNGQNFAFNGYLPIDKVARIKRIKELENIALKQKQAQYFIETPYRNMALFQDLINTLNPNSLLCLGVNLTDANQRVQSKTIAQWKLFKDLNIHKTPAVFGIYF